MWIGVNSNLDIGLRVDILVQAFGDGVQAGEARSSNLATGRSGFANAIL